MINFDDVDQLDKEIQEQTELLKTNTNGLEHDIKQITDLSETFSLLATENAELENRLAANEQKCQELQKQISVLEEVIRKRDGVMKILLKTVGDLNASVTQIRSSLTGK